MILKLWFLAMIWKGAKTWVANHALLPQVLLILKIYVFTIVVDHFPLNSENMHNGAFPFNILTALNAPPFQSPKKIFLSPKYFIMRIDTNSKVCLTYKINKMHVKSSIRDIWVLGSEYVSCGNKILWLGNMFHMGDKNF